MLLNVFMAAHSLGGLRRHNEGKIRRKGFANKKPCLYIHIHVAMHPYAHIPDNRLRKRVLPDRLGSKIASPCRYAKSTRRVEEVLMASRKVEMELEIPSRSDLYAPNEPSVFFWDSVSGFGLRVS